MKNYKIYYLFNLEVEFSDALEKLFKLESDIFLKTPKEFRNMAYKKIEGFMGDLEQHGKT